MTNPGGRLPRQDTTEILLRRFAHRIKLLEDELARVITGTTQVHGGSGGGGAIIYTQISPTTNWTIAHNLGRYVAVTLYDATGTEIEVDVSCPDLNTVVLASLEAFTGTAVVT